MAKGGERPLQTEEGGNGVVFISINNSACVLSPAVCGGKIHASANFGPCAHRQEDEWLFVSFCTQMCNLCKDGILAVQNYRLQRGSGLVISLFSCPSLNASKSSLYLHNDDPHSAGVSRCHTSPTPACLSLLLKMNVKKKQQHINK